MFSDRSVTPIHVETLLDLLRGTTRRFAAKKRNDMPEAWIARVFQPTALLPNNEQEDGEDDSPGTEGSVTGEKQTSIQVRATLQAARQLGLVRDTEEGRLELTFRQADAPATPLVVRRAIDERVLSSTDVEPYLAPFYSYLLFQGEKGIVKQSNREWATAFQRDVQGGKERADNPFNQVKYDGLRRWLAYAGLGWFDTNDVFQPNPYERVERSLPRIFGSEKRLGIDDFMDNLARACPELDGGSIFRAANPSYRHDRRECTLGLSHALIDLHLDGKIRLHCPQDIHGWSIAVAEPPRDDTTMRSTRVDAIELLAGAKR